MEFETINKETPEMKQLISGIKTLSKRVREIAQTHRPLFEGELYITSREVCERLFLSPRTLQDYRDKGIFPYTQIVGKILYRFSDLQRILQENLYQAVASIARSTNAFASTSKALASLRNAKLLDTRSESFCCISGERIGITTCSISEGFQC